MFDQILNRIKNKIIRTIRNSGFCLSVRQFNKITNSSKEFNLLIVAPGTMEVPSLGWGAVEHIITETIGIFEEFRFEVWMLNSKHRKEWKRASTLNFDVILNHSDQDSLKIKEFWPSTPLVTVSHYGFGAFDTLWNKTFKNILKKMDASDKIICLSEEVKKTFAKHIRESKLLVSPNGSSFNPVLGRDSKAPLVCVGKIETRKHQYELFKAFQSSKRKVVFIGPIVDERVLKRIKIDEEFREFFIGAKNREYLSKNLHKFSGLILPSSGEADALVLYEAQLTGLLFFVTKNGLGSQSIKLDWINVIEQNPKPDQIEAILNCYEISPAVVSSYARDNYSWSVRIKPLLQELLLQAKSNRARN